MDTLVANDLKGVGGWLLFRVLQLLVFMPLATGNNLIKLSTSGWVVASALIAFVGIVCGIAIALERPIALLLTGLHLMMMTAYWLCLALWIVFHGGLHTTRTFLTPAFSIAMCIAWLLYFRLSERVRNTFGRNL